MFTHAQVAFSMSTLEKYIVFVRTYSLIPTLNLAIEAVPSTTTNRNDNNIKGATTIYHQTDKLPFIPHPIPDKACGIIVGHF